MELMFCEIDEIRVIILCQDEALEKLRQDLYNGKVLGGSMVEVIIPYKDHPEALQKLGEYLQEKEHD